MYFSGEVSGRGSAIDVHTRSPSQRLTPSQFTQPHPIARFTNSGQLILITPSAVWSEDRVDPSALSVSLVNVREVIAEDPEVKEDLKQIEAFPGPLIRYDCFCV